ncbi:lytic transglycosylase domain-containing protein [Paraburkholderia hospita]|nr:lytic transglycosylase domain-containing protein [Paraburkholderia hospita]
MGGAFAVASTAVAALGVGIKSVMDLREQMNQQRSDSLATGLSGVRTEDLTRKLSAQGGGYVSREKASEGLRTLFDMTNQSYRNPTDLGLRRKLAALGINPGVPGSPSTAPLDVLGQLATKTSGMSDANIQGLARGTGLDIDWLRSFAKMGPGGVKNIGMSEDEVKAYSQGSDDVSKLNKDLQEFHNQVSQLETTLGEKLIPIFNTLLGGLNMTFDQMAGKKQPGAKKTKIVGYVEGVPIEVEDTSAQTPAAKEQEKQEEKKKQDAANAAADKSDQAARQGVQTQNEMAFAIMAFGSSVSSFNTGVTNLKQAWASWAGEIGKAAGVKGASGTGPVTLSGGGKGDWKSSPHADLIVASAKANGIDPQLMYAVMMTESGGVNGKTSSTGAGGLMQVTRGNWNKLGGGADVMDPAANIMVGGKILAEQLRIHKGDMDAGLRGYNGNSDPNYVDKVGKFYGGNAKGIGQSRETGMQIPAVQKAVADYLGVPLAQIQNGGVNRGDAAFALQQIKAGTNNNLFKLNNDLKNPMLNMQPGAKAALMRQIREQTAGTQMLDKFGQGVVDRQLNNDTRSMTQGQMPIITITVNGADHPQAVAKEVQNQLNKAMADLMANYASAEKG